MTLDILALVTQSVVSIAGFSIPATYVTRYVASMSNSLARYAREGRTRGKRLADLDWNMRHSAIEFLKQAHDYAGPGRGLVNCLQAGSAVSPTLQKLQGFLESSQIITSKVESSTLGRLSLDREARKMKHFAGASDVIRRLDTGLIIYSLSFFLSLMSARDACQAGDIQSTSKYMEAASKSLTKLESVLASRRAFVLNPDIPYSTFLSSLDDNLQTDMGHIASLEQILVSTDELQKPTIYGNQAEFLSFALGKGRYWTRLADLVKENADGMARDVDVVEFEVFVKRFRDRYAGVEASEKDMAQALGRTKKIGRDIDVKILPDYGRVVVCRSLDEDAARVEEQVRKDESVSAEDIEKNLGWPKLKVAYLLTILTERNRLKTEVLDGRIRYRLNAGAA